MGEYTEEEKNEFRERNRKEVLAKVEASFCYFSVEAKYRIMINEAFSRKDIGGVLWDFIESDGATAFKEIHRHSYAPYYVWHDYQMTRFKAGVSKYKNIIDLNLDFQKILDIYEVGIIKSYLFPILAILAFKLFGR